MITKFVIRKASRTGNLPYSGPTCERAGVEPGLVYYDREQAEQDAKLLTKYNPVGFEVVEVQ